MPYILKNLGDQQGDGHELNVGLMQDGTIIVHSNNPDTGEAQRVVLLQGQWQSLIRTLIGEFGADKCPFHRPVDICRFEETTKAA